MIDIHNRLKITTVHQKSLATAAALLDSSVVDTATLRSLEFYATKAACTATTGTFIITVQSGSANTASTHTTCTTSEIIGTNTQTLTATTADTVKIGYIGGDRYASVAVTAGAATGAITVAAIQGHDMKQPVT